MLQLTLILSLIVIVATPAWATEALTNTAELHAALIESGDEIALMDGRILHLQGIAASQEDPWQDKAQQILEQLAMGHGLVIDNNVIDRYGRLTAQVYALDDSGNKIWLQGEMLRQGAAFVYPPLGDEARLEEMLALETTARATEIGLWHERTYADTPADKAWWRTGHFAFVKGKVVEAKRIKNMVYLNFGANWRNDFTVAIAAHDLHNFRANGFDPLNLKDKTIRVRGWVKRNFGPMILATDPRQLEVLSEVNEGPQANAPMPKTRQ